MIRRNSIYLLYVIPLALAIWWKFFLIPSQPIFDDGALIRGYRSEKKLSLVFTGGDFGEGMGHILDVLSENRIKAGFFLTGKFLRNKVYQPLLQRAVREGHYLGPHSDAHLFYCSNENRSQSLVTEEQFKKDLATNIEDIRAFGALRRGEQVYFIPPYETYNKQHVQWARELNVILFNPSPWAGSARDFIPESNIRFVPSAQILKDIFDYEKRDPRGLNGFILLLHLGSQRRDKMHLMLEPLIIEIEKRGYEFVRMDRMLDRLVDWPESNLEVDRM